MTVEYPPEINTSPHEPSDTEQRTLYRGLLLRRVTVFVLVALVLISVTSSAVVVLLIRSSQTHNAPLLRETHSIAARIKSCTTPGKPCAQQNAQDIADALKHLDHNAAVSAAASTACAQTHEGYRAIYACTLHRLAADARHR